MARKNTTKKAVQSRGTTTDTSDALVGAMKEMANMLTLEQQTAKRLRSHLVITLSSLESIAEVAMEMTDKVEADTPLGEVHQLFFDLSNQAAQALVGNVWWAAHHLIDLD